MTIRIVRLGSPRHPEEGLRIGTVRRPPRGVPKAEYAARDLYDVWLPNLAPSEALLKEAQAAAAAGDERSWKSFVRRYRAEMKTPENSSAARYARRAVKAREFLVGCYCADETRATARCCGRCSRSGCQAGLGGWEDFWREAFMRDELQQLPAIGPSMAADLRRLGVRSVKDLARRDPERLYGRLCELTGARQDPCVLYTFRCAVYAARTPRPKSELLNWWAWKGRTLKGA